VRAQTYNQLEWASHSGYLRRILEIGQFESSHTVLDVGTGTGKIAHTVAPFVSRVVGVDISEAMLGQACIEALLNESFQLGDIYALNFADDTFDRVTARMVFHHLIQDARQAMQECYRVLKPSGMMILAEGVPPHISLREWYGKMFAFKEERITFMEDDLITLFSEAGFSNIETHVYISKQVSVQNWLKNSNLSQRVQDKIYQMHLELDAEARCYYNDTQLADDMLLDFKNVIVTGLKPYQTCHEEEI